MTEKLEAIPTRNKGKIYAVQRMTDKKYSGGGSGPSWRNYPKTWSAGPFKNHINMFVAQPYTFNVAKLNAAIAEKEAKGWKHYNHYYSEPENYTNYKLLHDKRFPYWDCEVLIIDVDGLSILERHSAPEWIWANVVKPYFDKEPRYLPQIEEFCKEYGISYD